MKDQNTPSSSQSATIALIVAVSLLALGFLCWLLFVHHANPATNNELDWLLPFEAVFNAASAVAIIIGLRLIRQHRTAAHRNAMMTAFAFSAMFLICYIVHHALHGDVLFQGHGIIRVSYFVILITHILLSAIALPLILTTFFFALTARFMAHRKLARLTYPIWLYVSLSGVVVYAMLAVWK